MELASEMKAECVVPMAAFSIKMSLLYKESRRIGDSMMLMSSSPQSWPQTNASPRSIESKRVSERVSE